MKNISGLLFIFCIIFFSFSSKSQNLAVVDIDYVINNSKQYKNILNDIFQSQETKKKNFIKQEKIINTKKKDIENSKLVLNDEEIQLKIDEYNQILADFKDSIDVFNNHYNNQIQEIRNQVLGYIIKLLEKYALKNKIDLIFDNKNYIIASNSINITDIILEELDTLDLNLKFDPL